MKNAINKVRKTTKNLGEVALFRAMEAYIKRTHNAVLVEETHQCYVTFNTKNCTQIKKEISDLWIITFSPNKNEARMTFLQAKYERKKRPIIHQGFSFTGDYFQFKLLSERPIITNASTFNFPNNILSFTNSDAIGSFGVFYIDNNQQVDMVFSTASNLTCKSGTCTTKTRVIYLNKPNKNANYVQNQYGNQELLDSFYISEFENGLLNLEIGAEIHQYSTIMNYVNSVLGSIPNVANSQAYQDFKSLMASGNIGSDLNLTPNLEFNPAILLINVDDKN
ncbi:MAG: hypothetical protein AAFX55_00995 [Bacteroidota bacterium]